VWGGELLLGDLAEFERVGILFPVRMPGGEAAIRQPWRMACAWLSAALDVEPARPASLPVARDMWHHVAELARTGVASPLTSSAGRLFDAVAALCGVRGEVSYEGQAAIELEAACDPREDGAYPLPLAGSDNLLLLDPRETVRAVADEVAAGVARGVVAARFHNAMADATARACQIAAEGHGTPTVVLSGGVFQNRRLLERTAAVLDASGLRVLTPERLPPNDGGIAYGQAAVAAARLAREGDGR
jgi:hydrogenase maturation protein HypF